MTGSRSKSVSQSQSESQPGPLQADQLLVILGEVTKRLSDHKGNNEIMDDSDTRLLFTHLRDVLSTLVSDNSEFKGRISALEAECVDSKKLLSLMSEKATSLEGASRIHSDLSDHHHQRSLKGKFAISSLSPSDLETREELDEKGIKIETYVCTLIKKKFAFEAHEKDIHSCHFSKKGIIFRMGTLSPNSIYGEIVTSIKTGQGQHCKNIFFNFALTPKRASLLFELRKAKKAKVIEKLYSDNDGTVSYVSFTAPINSRGRKEKTRITSVYDRVDGGGFNIRTFSVAELREQLDAISVLNSSSHSH